MYGTIARLRVKPGSMQTLMKMTTEEDQMNVPGLVNTIVYQMDNDPNECYMVVLFENKESYRKNAESPDQDARYREFVQHLEGPPEWHDGEIIYQKQ